MLIELNTPYNSLHQGLSNSTHTRFMVMRNHILAHTHMHTHSPSVVGCLWEVTDGDIDRFSKALLKSITSNSSYLSTIVGDSRRACKLPWITGAAPVVYGVPVSFKLHIQIPELPWQYISFIVCSLCFNTQIIYFDLIIWQPTGAKPLHLIVYNILYMYTNSACSQS